MKCSSAVACATLAFSVIAILLGCDVYDSRLLPLGNGDPSPDAGLPYIERCGDGRLDADELCDTAIEAGQTGECPDDCPSEDPCTPRVAVGEGCQRSCVDVPVRLALNDDGCCPSGIGAADDSDCGECGDGITGPTETCEPASSCVTQDECESAPSCLKGTFSGVPESCTSLCRFELVEACQNGDGCCPEACDAGNDDDCSATCGNGIVEPENNEICEPNSTSKPCPASCDDSTPCTMDLASGTAQQCNLTCTHVAITAPASGDGCCPGGANSTNDGDCLPVCGNLIVETGEACDPCPDDCDDADACTTDTPSGSGCNFTCGHTAITTFVGGDGCCPSGASSLDDSDCPVVCGNGVTEAGEDCDGSGRCNGNCDLVLPSSLVHRYSFDGTGTTVLDSMGTAHGTVINTTLSGNGRLALAGGSSNQYVDLPNGIISELTDITVEAWVTWQGGSTSHRVFDFGMNSAGEGANTGTGTHYFYLNPRNGSSDQLMVGMNFTDAGNDYAVADYQILVSPLSTGSRHHLVVTYRDPGAGSTKTLTLYVNGAQQASVSVPASVSGTDNRLSNLDDRNVWLGRSTYSATPTFAGSFEEFRIYNAALSGAQVTSNFNAGPNP